MVDVVVVGAGVIGLSAAIELRRKGLDVVIVAKDLPEDTESVGFASPWAGCNWHSFESDSSTRQAGWDRVTFKRLADLASQQPNLCERIPFRNVWTDQARATQIWFQDLVGDYEYITSPSRLPVDKPFGHSFSSYIINAPEYLAYLSRTAREMGVPIRRKRLASLDHAFDIPGIGKVPLVVNATGLGARSLIGVEDTAVYPARGQTVLVRAPEVSQCVMHCEAFINAPVHQGKDAPPEPAYIIPRPGPDGLVVLGGTYIKDNWSPLPDLKVSERILRDCYKLDPKLAGSSGTSWKDIEVVSHNVGHRPAREGGARLELQERKDLLGSPLTSTAKANRKPGGAVIHAYGFGGAGYQCSLGVAEEVTSIAQDFMTRRSKIDSKL